MRKLSIVFITGLMAFSAFGQSYNRSKFHQIDELLPTPNSYRTGSGAPGHEYWQQRADYVINVSLDDAKQKVIGSETITYFNNSPDPLQYIWIQLDQNLFKPGNMTYLTEDAEPLKDISFDAIKYINREDFQGGYTIKKVADANGNPLHYAINNTMMRIDLPKVLPSKSKFTFSIDWENLINNCKTHGGRGGYEFFEEDGNYIYEMAQWFPRLCVYDDVNGWQNKQFLGRGEFALTFGNYEVNITVPADHIVGSTGVLQNEKEVLTSAQIERLNKARSSNKPLMIVTQDEAKKNEKSKLTATKTWKFKADSVRDFAWASSRKFIWDGMNTKVGNKDILCMSYYPKEGNPLWEKYSTQSIAHTLEVYSRYTVNYPYPVAISVNGPVGGMEYPMICFNGPRPEADGTYSDRTKYALITVIIHEVGHNFFPMIINSDERQWTWMDEGLNTFCQYLAEKEWEENYPARRGEPKDIVAYMGGDKSNIMPIMTNSESILQFGNNAYGKPATTLNILRETVMGRELFDFAFKQYAERWAFKHPMPADFFRTMEDASGVDLDWFWKGWFYTTDACDIAIKDVHYYTIDSKNPEIEKKEAADKLAAQPLSKSQQLDKEAIKKVRTDDYPELLDFYNSYDPIKVTAYDKKQYDDYIKSLTPEEKAWLNKGLNFYVVDFENIGGLVMPLIVELEFEDGSKEVKNIPAEIWRLNNEKVSKLFITNKKVKQFSLDPYLQTADVDLSNNFFPEKIIPSKFQLYKNSQNKKPNLMQLDKQGKL
jgi:hypothetical protein